MMSEIETSKPVEGARNIGALLLKGLNKAVDLQYPLAEDNVARLQRVHPDKTPAELISLLNKWYLGAVAATGGAAGASAIVPNVAGQIAVATFDVGTFIEASVLYTFSVAKIHNVHVEDLERRRALVLAVLVGDAAARTLVNPLLERTAPHLGKVIVTKIPTESLRAINKVLGQNFITKWGTKQGILVLGKQVPLLIGFAVGVTGNLVFGKAVVNAAKGILGPAPESWVASANISA